MTAGPRSLHRYSLRVYYEDTDAGGVVYHANYLRYAERARTEALRDAGIAHAELVERFHLMFMVHRAEIDYVRPAMLDGLLGASVWVWAVVFEKWSTLRKVNKAADGFEDRFWSGGSLDELFDSEGSNPNHPMAAVFAAAMGEWRRSIRVAGADISHTSVR